MEEIKYEIIGYLNNSNVNNTCKKWKNEVESVIHRKKLVNVLFNNAKNDKDKLSNELSKLEKNSKINLRRVRMNKWY